MTGDPTQEIIGRVPPHSMPAERWVLGQMLFSDEVTRQSVDCLTESCFYLTSHRLIFTAIRTLQVEGAGVDEITVSEQLKSSGKLEEAGGLAGLLELTDDVVKEQGIRHLARHAATLIEKANRRKLIHLGARMFNEAYDESNPVEELASGAQSTLRSQITLAGHADSWRLTKFLNWSTDEPSWIVKPFVGPKDVMFMVSDAGVGKTWLLCDLMLSVVMGRQWLGRFPTSKTSVLYVDFDGHGDGDALRRRLRRLAFGYGLSSPFDQLEGSAEIMTRFHLPQGVNLYKNENVGHLKEHIRANGFGLVIIDTFISVHGADRENDAGQMGIVMNRLREVAYETGAAIIVAHHSRKEVQGGDNSGSSNYRGSTAIKGMVDCMVEAKKQKLGIIRMIHAKPRHVRPLEDFATSISDVGEGVVVQVEDEDKLSATKKSAAMAWIMGDLWALPEGSEGIMSQGEIISIAKREGIASDRNMREALTKLNRYGKITLKLGHEIGKTGNQKFWLKEGHDVDEPKE